MNGTADDNGGNGGAEAPFAPVFVSHGAPDLVLARTEAARFLSGFGKGRPRPRSILVASAHFETPDPVVVTDPAPGMIYDFGGFDPRLRTLVYPAPGAPGLAERVAGLLSAAGHAVAKVDRRGYDHGAWVPLMLMYPEADIPVAQLSISPRQSARWHYEVGRALAPLSGEGVQIVGSGALTHNLAEIFRPDGIRDRSDPVPDWVDAFADWIAGRLAEGDVSALLDYRARAPNAERNHPTWEHLMPLFVALGAAMKSADEAVRGRRLHASREFGVLAMDAYAMETTA